MRCGFCGIEFREEEGERGCGRCGNAAGCRMIRCPRCNYENPAPSKMAERIGRIVSLGTRRKE
ncbi:MAG: hypothetical protein Fur0034_02550 [Desulfuromonadia bacterium]